MVQQIYKVFIGILLAATVGFGIATFYPAPEHPRFEEPFHQPKSLEAPAEPTEDDFVKQQEYEQQLEEYNAASESHNRNTAIIAVAAALLIFLISMTVLSVNGLIADGLLLGGIFTLVYGILRSAGTGNQKFMFFTTLVGLVSVIVIGHLKFVRPQNSAKSTRKAKNKK